MQIVYNGNQLVVIIKSKRNFSVMTLGFHTIWFSGIVLRRGWCCIQIGLCLDIGSCHFIHPFLLISLHQRRICLSADPRRELDYPTPWNNETVRVFGVRRSNFRELFLGRSTFDETFWMGICSAVRDSIRNTWYFFLRFDFSLFWF